ncbi:MAG TPA: VOC family protein [Candidatus Binataceae bacterium]|nr:VOC family protein [Candidatus Binataceae bacterium]
MITSIFHININCTNFERSLDFYQKLGFKVVRDLGETALRKVNPGLRLPVDARLRAVLMVLGDNPRSTRLDLIEWKSPKTIGTANADLLHAGMARIALRTKTLIEDYEDLKTKGIEFWTEPIMIDLPGAKQEGFVCCQDPDGTVIELIQA